MLERKHQIRQPLLYDLRFQLSTGNFCPDIVNILGAVAPPEAPLIPTPTTYTHSFHTSYGGVLWEATFLVGWRVPCDWVFWWGIPDCMLLFCWYFMLFIHMEYFYLGINTCNYLVFIYHPMKILSSSRRPSHASLWSERSTSLVRVSEVWRFQYCSLCQV